MLIRSIGYVVVATSDLAAWKAFGSDLLGLAVEAEDAHSLQLRMDSRSYRVMVVRGDREGVSALGWEVAGPVELDEVADRLTSAGVACARMSPETLAIRGVTEGLIAQDPDGVTVEFSFGLKSARGPFVSPTGTRFVTGSGGFGHAFQFVTDSAAFEDFYVRTLGLRLSDHIEFAGGSATFLHCNPRHHSLAFAQVPGIGPGFGHLMFEVEEMDMMGRVLDRVLDGAAPLSTTLGRHTNDAMLSFYVTSPSGFSIEYGHGGVLVEDEFWTPTRYPVTSVWGHKRQNPAKEPEI